VRGRGSDGFYGKADAAHAKRENLSHIDLPLHFAAIGPRHSTQEYRSLTRAEVIVEMAQIVGAVGMANNLLSNARPKIGFPRYPVEVTFFGDQL